MMSPLPSDMTPHPFPGHHPAPLARPQTMAYGLCDSPPGLLAYMLDAIQPTLPHKASSAPSSQSSSRASSSTGHSPVIARSPMTMSAIGTPTASQSPVVPQISDQQEVQGPWDPTSLINWTMLYWLPGPEVALRWLANSAVLVPSLWMGYSNVPLGISYYQEPSLPGFVAQSPPQWAESYHRVAMLRRREGRVRFAAWERPADVVLDLRELAMMVASSS